MKRPPRPSTTSSIRTLDAFASGSKRPSASLGASPGIVYVIGARLRGAPRHVGRRERPSRRIGKSCKSQPRIDMITLYGMTSPNVVKIIIALEELGLPHEHKAVDVFTGQQFDPD